MSLRGKLNDKLEGAWTKLDDVPISCTVKQVTAESYDPATSEAVSTFVEHGVDVVLTSLTEQQSQELTGGLGQYQGLIRLAQISIIPKEGDILEIDNESYKVVGTDVDPARVLWTGFLSKRGKIDDGLAG